MAGTTDVGEALRSVLESQARMEALLSGLAGDLRAHLQRAAGKDGPAIHSSSTRLWSASSDSGGASSAVRPRVSSASGPSVGYLLTTTTTVRSVKEPGLRMGRSLSTVMSPQHTALALPTDWPKSLKPRQQLAATGGGMHAEDAMRSALAGWRIPTEHPSQRPAGGARWARWIAGLLRGPRSPFQHAITLLSLLFQLYDLIIVPALFAWDLELRGWLMATTLASALFWTGEAALRALRGADAEDDMGIEPLAASVRRYVRTWLCLDVLLLTLDWLAFGVGVSICGPGADRNASRRLLRSVRLLRVAGAIRAFRLMSSMQVVAEWFLSDYAREILALALLALVGLWSCHLVACGWLAIGRYAPSDTGRRWVEKDVEGANQTLVPFEETAAILQYLDALSFAILQLTLAGSNVVPSSAEEQLFMVVTVFVGFLVGSLLLSTLSARLLEFGAPRRERHENMRLLRRYLGENQVAPEIATHILQQAHSRLTRPGWLKEESVPVLGSLSVALISKLRITICGPQLVALPLFGLLETMDEVWFGQLVNDAVSMIFLSPGDELFKASCVAVAAYRVAGGSLVYLQDPKSSPVSCAASEEVPAGALVAEPALWSEWTHVGTMCATSLAKVVQLRAEAFMDVLQRHQAIWDIAQAYGRAYFQRLLAASPPARDWPSDLQVPCTDFGVLVYDLPHDISSVIALQVLASHRVRRLRGRRSRELLQEVESGKSVVIPDGKGGILRVTSVVALEVSREEDFRHLWQVARFEGGSWRADLELPGTKREKCEDIDSAIQRLLESKMPQLLGDNFEVDGQREESTEKQSSDFLVLTRYLRTVVWGTLRGDLEVEYCEFSAAVGHAISQYSHLSVVSGAGVLDVQVNRSISSALFQLPEVLRSGRVFTMCPGSHHVDRRSAFAWLLPEEVRELQTPRGQRALASYILHLSPPSELPAVACAPSEEVSGYSLGGDPEAEDEGAVMSF